MLYRLLPLILLVSCQKYTVNVKKQTITKDQIASHFAHTPDPENENFTPYERYLVRWNIKKWQENLTLKLQLITQDFSEKELSYPITKRAGRHLFILGKGPKTITYRAFVETGEGIVLSQTQHALFFKLIADKRRVVSSHERQGSVSDGSTCDSSM